jgi:hypothetical protein
MYSHTDKSGNAFKFGTEKRSGKVVNKTPGPGSYHIPCTIADVPKYVASGGSFDPRYKYV